MNIQDYYILNSQWQITDTQDFIKKAENNKWVIFGDSTRNSIIYETVPSQNILYICDSNESKTNTLSNGIIIKGWNVLTEYKDICVVTVLKNYKFLAGKVSEYNIKSIFYFVLKEEYEKLYAKYSVFMPKIKDINSKCSKNFKYIHFFLDEKFVKLFYGMLEDKFEISEHLFVIYGINSSNVNDKYSNYENYVYWSELNKNIMILDDTCNINGVNYDNELKKLSLLMEGCRKIVFHGEFLTSMILDFMRGNISFVQEKAVWCQWADYPGGNKVIDKAIDTVLKKCRYTTLSDVAMNQLKELYPNDELPEKIVTTGPYISKRETFAVDKKQNNVTNILVATSGSILNNIFESFRQLYKFRNENINIYAIFSYGDKNYIQEAVQKGQELFGEKFIVIKDYLEYNDYVKLLSKMDIYVNGSEKGGLSTVMLLFEMGTKLYIQKASKLEKILSAYDFYYNYINEITEEDFERFINNIHKEKNIRISKGLNDYEQFAKNWKTVLE